MRPDIEGAIRIAWSADPYETIKVLAPRRGREELEEFARGVADEALLERTVHDLRVALRQRFDGTFDLETREARVRSDASEEEAHILVTVHPPRTEGDPDF